MLIIQFVRNLFFKKNDDKKDDDLEFEKLLERKRAEKAEKSLIEKRKSDNRKYYQKHRIRILAAQKRYYARKKLKQGGQ